MTLLAIAIEELGVPAAFFTGSQAGIITDERHVAAQVIEARPWRVRRALDEGRVAIVAGFQGVSRNGRHHPRAGGTDTTAVVLAAALGATHCEICSDVDGIYSADPRVVPDAKRLDEIPLDAAVAMSRAGSKVLLADAVERARELGVQLMASATASPPGSGTALPPGPAPGRVVAVAADAQLVEVVVQKGGPAALASASGAVRAWWTESERLHALVDLRNLHGQADLSNHPGVSPPVPAAALTAVAGGLDPAVVQSVPPSRPWAWSGGGQWCRLDGLVPRHVADAAQRALHAAVVGGGDRWWV